MSHAIVLGYDGSDMAKAALKEAIDLAKAAPEGKVVLVYGHGPVPWFAHGPVDFIDPDIEACWRSAEAEGTKRLEEAAALVREAGLEADLRFTFKPAVEALVEAAQEAGAEMIVVGTRGAGPHREILVGSTPLRLLHVSTTPVLVVPLAA